MPFPYTHPTTGGMCCSARAACCPRCEARLAEEARTLRSATDHTPPDIYAQPLADLRLREAKAAAARTHTPTPRPTTMPLDANGIPDIYAAGLAAMKENNR